MRKLKIRSCVRMTVAMLCLLALSGCERKTINEILADPARYANKDVTVVGSVTRSYSVFGKGAYEVEDGTGRLWVVSDKGVPREGAKIMAKGTIRDGFNLGSVIKLPETISTGLVMIEKSHKAK